MTKQRKVFHRLTPGLNLFIISQPIPERENALLPPYNRPWNDQPWKRDLLRRDQALLNMRLKQSEMRKSLRGKGWTQDKQDKFEEYSAQVAEYASRTNDIVTVV
jgi:hypothetical protein